MGRAVWEKRIVGLLVAGCCIFAAASAAVAQDKGAQSWSARAQAAEYRIGAGDVLEITTWKEPELSRRDILVRLDGKISFPLLGDVAAAGMTPVELTDTIQKGLKNYVTSPVVTVTVTNPGSQRIYILGEVARTGEYPLTKNLTVLQAFALAGGFTQWAAKDEIILLRGEPGREKIYKINYKDIVRGRGTENNLPLQANDTIVVP
ncbi:MAG: polysaccharide biosynthesis/export family protein [Desulfobacterales bacterium]